MNAMSKTNRHKSQLDQGIEWGAKRIGDKGYRGMPCHYQKKLTARAERIHGRMEIVKELWTR